MTGHRVMFTLWPFTHFLLLVTFIWYRSLGLVVLHLLMITSNSTKTTHWRLFIKYWPRPQVNTFLSHLTYPVLFSKVALGLLTTQQPAWPPLQSVTSCCSSCFRKSFNSIKHSFDKLCWKMTYLGVDRLIGINWYQYLTDTH